MKKIVLIFITFALIVMGCEHKDVYQTKKVDFDNIVPFAAYEVPLKEGMVSIVIYGEDTLAITGIPMNINVPKEAVKNLTKSTAPIRVVYSNEPKFEGYKDCGTIQTDCVLLFEDTRSGDNDYNDLIIWAKKKETRTYWPDYIVSCEFTIHPIALGAIKNFKLGVVNEQGTEFILAENCREELFKGEKGFINTETNVAPKTYPSKMIKTKEWKYNPNVGNTTINWFIETADERMYIAETNKAVNQSNLEQFGNEKGRPYGIAFPTTGANIFKFGGPFYATECTPIQQIYNNFEGWIQGEGNINDKGVNNTDPQICYNFSNPH
ncbi:hypothetical protein [Odoribacter laneus]